MNSTLKPSPLKKLRIQKGWRLVKLYEELKAQGTPISWPTLVNIDRGFKVKIIRHIDKTILKEEKLPYKPNKRLLVDIAKVFEVPVKKVYKDMSSS